MALRNIHIWPDPVLREPALPVEKFAGSLKTLIADMFETMYAAEGIGLAANQIGVLQQVIVLDLGTRAHVEQEMGALTAETLKEKEEQQEYQAYLEECGFTGPVALINPRFSSQAGSLKWEEGCLSVPGVRAEIKRFAEVVVDAYDVEGQSVRVAARGLYAVALQHEIDHLHGRVFVEYLSKLRRETIKKEMQRLQAEQKAVELRPLIKPGSAL